MSTEPCEECALYDREHTSECPEHKDYDPSPHCSQCPNGPELCRCEIADNE